MCAGVAKVLHVLQEIAHFAEVVALPAPGAIAPQLEKIAEVERLREDPDGHVAHVLVDEVAFVDVGVAASILKLSLKSSLTST